MDGDNGITHAATALVTGSQQRHAPPSCAGCDAVKRECGGSGCGAFNAQHEKWWFALTLNVVKVEDHVDQSDGVLRSMLQHTLLASR